MVCVMFNPSFSPRRLGCHYHRYPSTQRSIGITVLFLVVRIVIVRKLNYIDVSTVWLTIARIIRIGQHCQIYRKCSLAVVVLFLLPRLPRQRQITTGTQMHESRKVRKKQDVNEIV